MSSRASRQFRVLHREFLFRIVDRDVLSSHGTGDASQLLVQFAALLIFVGLASLLPIEAFEGNLSPRIRLMLSWSIEHFLIATTMLVVGLFGVLTWENMFPDRRDVHVLAPLPVATRTILLAKVGAVITALTLTVLSLHVAAGLAWPLVLNTGSGTLAVLRMYAAYWITMIAAAVFMIGLVMGVQGLAAQLLPRRWFLRVSSLLQIGAFALIVSVYCLQGLFVSPERLIAAAQEGRLPLSPSYWFLGLFQSIAGSSVLAPLARPAWIGVTIAAFIAALAYAGAYVRVLRKIAEQPDIVPGASGLRWLPPFGTARQTAIVQFSVRTLLRSAQQRMVLAFYLGIGFALSIFFMKLPRARASAAAPVWLDGSLPLMLSSILMVGFAVLGGRMAFSLPRDLRANWIFRITPLEGGARYLSARRRALFVVAVVPVWTLWAVLACWSWPWPQALGHLAVLALLGAIFVELSMHGVQKIPFTCAYLPGKSAVHATFWVVVMLMIPLAFAFARRERRALQDPVSYAVMLAVLVIAWGCARWSTTWLSATPDAVPEFEEERPGAMATLDLWDVRFQKR